MNNKLINPMCYMPDKYVKHLYEHLHMSLLESGGVAAYEYQEQIEAIVNSFKQIDTNEKHIEINVNKSDDTKIDIADDFKIKVNFNDMLSDPVALYVPVETKIVNKHVKRIVFEINIPNDIPDDMLLIVRRLLYHEFTHCKEDINRQLNNNQNIEDIYLSSNSRIKYEDVTNVLINSENYEELEVTICNILYRLFVDTERNALCNELYGELINVRNNGVKINRNNIRDIIFDQTETGQDYVYFRNLFDTLSKSNNWIVYVIPYININFIKTKLKGNIHNLYDWFVRYMDNALRTVFKQMCKVSETFLINENKDYHDCLKLADNINNVVTEHLTNYGFNKNAMGIYKTYKVNWNTRKDKINGTTRTAYIKVNNVLTNLLENKKFK